MTHEPSVLVVDDEPRLRKTLVQMVQTLGFPARDSATAEEAMRLLQSDDPPRILILDLMLPAMHGIDLFEWLAKERPETRVIVLTGFGDLETAQRAIRLGVVDYLTKPCTMGELEKALERARAQLREQGIAAAAAQVNETQASEQPQACDDQSPATLAQLERQHILDALHRNNGNRRLAAAELGISLRTLYYRLSQIDET